MQNKTKSDRLSYIVKNEGEFDLFFTHYNELQRKDSDLILTQYI